MPRTLNPFDTSIDIKTTSEASTCKPKPSVLALAEQFTLNSNDRRLRLQAVRVGDVLIVGLKCGHLTRPPPK